MGMELHPVFRPAGQGGAFEAEGKTLAQQILRLDQLAKQRGLKPLGSFADPREPDDDFEPPPDFDGDPETFVDLACGPWDDWFPASDGLRTVEGLIAAIQAEPRLMKSVDPEEILHDLDALAECLRAGAAKGAAFRLEVR